MFSVGKDGARLTTLAPEQLSLAATSHQQPAAAPATPSAEVLETAPAVEPEPEGQREELAAADLMTALDGAAGPEGEPEPELAPAPASASEAEQEQEQEPELEPELEPEPEPEGEPEGEPEHVPVAAEEAEADESTDEDFDDEDEAELNQLLGMDAPEGS